jgi:enoyl-CoA hydratase/carnithine racemase
VTEQIERIEQNGILEIHIDRVDKKNALTAAMYRAMTAALEDASRHDHIRAVLITGRGGDFCAGNDLKDFISGPAGSEAAFAFIRAIAGFDKPIVAAVAGLAIGVGTTMLLHCDLVYAEPGARFIMPFVNLGLVPEAGASLLAPARLGYAKAAAMLFLGEPLDADGADRAGLISAVVPAGEALNWARAKAAALGQQPQRAVKWTRALMKGDKEARLARIEEEAAIFAEAMQTHDAIEAITAALEKRAPVFRKSS